MGSSYVVTGEIVFPGGMPPKVPAIYVRVEDVSYSDAPAQTVAEEVLRDVRIPENGSLGFSLPVGEPQPSADYSVRVHADVDGDGEISSGDFISVQRHPVLTYGQPNRVTIHLRRV